MQPTPKLQRLIEALAAKHGFDLDQFGPSLRLFLPGHDYLVIEYIGNYRVALTNYIERDYQLAADPRVVLYTRYDREDGSYRWLPIESTEVFFGWRMFLEVTRDGDDLLLYDVDGHVELAQRCEGVFACNIEQAGWLRNATRVELPQVSRTREELLAEGWEFEGEYSLEESDHAQPRCPS